MRIVFAPDSFKESLSAPQAAHALAEGWLQARPGDEVDLAPMADGGEGTAEALISASGGHWERMTVHGPMNEPREAACGILGDGETAIIEMASASGLMWVPREQRNPGVATTFGTGELMRHALELGVRQIIVGLGGSATNDGGAGMAQALGYRLLDAQGADLPPGGLALAGLERIDASQAHPALKQCEVRVACDVDNPLCGPRGASLTYGPQKGATPEMARQLDIALEHFAAVVARDLGVAMAGLPGSGAAGGIGGGLVAFAGGRLERGVGLVADACGLAARIQRADLVITGEGRIDGQTAHGKTPVGVAALAKAAGVPVVAVAGEIGRGHEAVYAHGIDAVFSILPGPRPLEDALEHAEAYTRQTGERLARVWSMLQ